MDARSTNHVLAGCQPDGRGGRHRRRKSHRRRHLEASQVEVPGRRQRGGARRVRGRTQGSGQPGDARGSAGQAFGSGPRFRPAAPHVDQEAEARKDQAKGQGREERQNRPGRRQQEQCHDRLAEHRIGRAASSIVPRRPLPNGVYDMEVNTEPITHEMARIRAYRYTRPTSLCGAGC